METPLKSSRRKLKKIMKKSRASLSVSTNNIYQKKLKSAINVSLNSTRTVRTLQSNNRSLATSLEKMRQDFRQVHDHYTLLLEENHELREKILELQRINVSEKYIDQEVDKRVEGLRTRFVIPYTHIRNTAVRDLAADCIALVFYEKVWVPVIQKAMNGKRLNVKLAKTSTAAKDACVDCKRSVKERNEHMKRKLVLLSDIATRFLDTLAELSDICVSSKSSTLEDLSSTESANQNYSLLPNLPPISSDVSLDNMSDLESSLSGHSAEIEYSDFEKNIGSRRKQVHEMTTVMEQSVLCPSTDIFSSVSSKLDEVLGSFPSSSGLDKRLTTKLPVRIAKPLSQTETQANDQGSKGIGALKKQKSVGSPKRVTRRQTFVVANGPTDDCLITDVATPPFLVSDCLPENGALDINGKDQVRTPVTPARVEALNEKRLSKRSTSLKKNSLKQSPTLTPRGKERSPIKSSSLQQQIPSPKGTKQSSKRSTRSRKRQTSPKKSPAAHKENQMVKKMSFIEQKSTTLAKKRNAAPSLNAISPNSAEKQQSNFFISNEFNLMNVHKGKFEKSNQVNCNSIIKYVSPSKEIGEQTIFPVDDMEITRMEESIIGPSISVKQLSSIGDIGGNAKSTELEPHLPATYPRSRSKQSEQAVGDADGSAEEKIPDAVTMRCTKPGQMMFAAARKESDGTRKNVPLVSKVRSRSKKRIAEMIENMVDTQPETIFDFHDKTPVFLNSEKQKSTSVFNFSADQSKLSPLTPLNKNRSRNRKSNSSSNDLSSKSTSQSQSLVNDQHVLKSKECIMIEVSVPLKDDSPSANSTYKTRSRSLGRRQHVTEDGNMEVKARSQSRRRRAKSHVGSPANIMTSSSSVTSSEVMSTNCSSSATDDQYCESKSDTHLISNELEDDQAIVESRSISDALCKQKENGEEDLQVSNKEITGKKISKSRSTKALSKRQVYDKELEQNNGIPNNEDVNATPDECIISVMQEETTEKGSMEIAESDKVDFCGTSKKTTSESLSDVQDTEAVVLKKKMKVTSRKTREKSLPKSSPKIDANESESESSEPTNYISTRRDRTKGMKENKSYKNPEVKDEGKSTESTLNDLAAIGDSAAQMAALVDVSNAAKMNLEISVETGQLLEQLKCLRTPAFSHSEDMQSAVVSPTSSKDVHKKNEPGLRASKIVRGTPPGRSQSVPKRAALIHSPESESAAGSKRRRAATHVNYAELKLNKKLRRGDPFTSHYCTGDKITIFKSPKGKKKIVKSGTFGSLHNQSISEELMFPSEESV